MVVGWGFSSLVGGLIGGGFFFWSAVRMLLVLSVHWVPTTWCGG